MRVVTIQPVEKPKSFADVKFTEAEWNEAVKVGPKEVPMGTAMEALRNSKGLYQIKREAKEVDVVIHAKPVSEMSAVELAAEMTAHGKPPRKKMNRKDAMAFVEKLREEAAKFIVDEDDDDE